MNDYATLIAHDTVRFERLLPGPIERVWAYLTESDKRALWLAGGAMTLASDGAIELNFRNAELSNNDDRAPEKYRAYENSGRVVGTITRCEPPTLLAYTWSDGDETSAEMPSEVSFELTPHGDRVLLLLTHRRLCADAMTSVAGGWHTHLGILEDRLHEREARPFWRTHTAVETEYERRLR
jgi:uncharacterized protein YndB with AHSA1/START domain